jgi:hypothetical protein
MQHSHPKAGIFLPSVTKDFFEMACRLVFLPDYFLEAYAKLSISVWIVKRQNRQKQRQLRHCWP